MPVLEQEASYSTDQDGSFTVIAGCPLIDGQKGTALGAIPSSKTTPGILEKARAGGYQDFLVECR